MSSPNVRNRQCLSYMTGQCVGPLNTVEVAECKQSEVTGVQLPV